MTQPIIIGIAGGTGSGKTSVAKALVKDFIKGQTIIIEQDWYYKNLPDYEPETIKNWNFDHPNAIEFDLLIKDLKKLKAKESIEVPQYDYSTHSRKKETRRIDSHPVIIIEGILIMNESPIRDLMDIKIFVDTEADIRFIRRLKRDINKRKRTLESVIDQYYRTVRPMHESFVENSKRFADIIIPRGAHNKVAVDLLKTKIRTLLEG
ncbi:MAG: uridine kinase [Candidatus Marinimicrobia bacterium]|nr:uridine kinase [Candidatus Neomarinimicrobiota bacterium]